MNSSTFFQNKDCEYFPCHQIDDVENFNCLFCYCPLYPKGNCIGNYYYTKAKKHCEQCDFPHIRENYDKLIETLKQ